MATRRAITERTSKPRRGSTRTALDAQPLPSSSSKSGTKFERAKEARQLTLSDAEIAVRWLNTSKGTRSRDRVVFIRRELEALQSAWADHSAGTPWDNPRPGVTNAEEFWNEHRQLEMRHHLLNKVLGRYVFRPRVTYNVYVGTWHFGMVPDDNRKSFQMKIGDRTIAEADAVMAMVRLDSTGDLGRFISAGCAIRNGTSRQSAATDSVPKHVA